MTRAETLAAIKKAQPEDLSDYHTHYPGCVLHHQDCAIEWLLQEIEYLKAQIAVRDDVVLRCVSVAERVMAEISVDKVK